MKLDENMLGVVSVPDLSVLFLEEDVPDGIGSDVTSEDYSVISVLSENDIPIPEKCPLKWEFTGLTVWVELEEFEKDLTTAIKDFASTYGVRPIPQSHLTAIYGMEHLTIEEAKKKFQKVKEHIPSWPTFDKPVGLVSDIAVAGRPGQVCTIAWSEITLSSNSKHEEAMDTLYDIFYGTDHTRMSPWKPHNSIAYDNPEDHDFSLGELVAYAAKHPTLLSKERKVSALSLWSTYGKMEDWECLDRICFP